MSTPEALYRNAIDLNRYSNSVARRVINAYNDIIIDSVNQLRTIDDLAAPVKAARLRGILAQLKESLAGWAGDASELMVPELQGLAQLQSEFVTEELRKALPVGSRDAVRTVEISPQFAQSVVTTDPTQLNVVALSDDLFAAVEGAEALARQAGTGDRRDRLLRVAVREWNVSLFEGSLPWHADGLIHCMLVECEPVRGEPPMAC